MRYRPVQLRHFVSVALLALLAACGDDGPTDPGEGGTGTVEGIVTAADGETPIPLATVTLASGSGPSTETDTEGAYTLDDVPAGSQMLRATRGNFEVVFNVQVVANQTVTAQAAELEPIGGLAYVAGSFDHIEDLVSGELGNPIDELTADQLGSAATLDAYSMIFLNCGLDESPASDPETIATLLAWVRAGGVLYASDWAMAYVQALLPDDILEIDSGMEQAVVATVTDSDLEAFVGKDNVDIQYDLGGWIGLKSISTAPRVLLRGDYDTGAETVLDRPLAIVVEEGAGRIIYTTFHNEAGVTIDQLAVLRYYVYLD